MTATQKLQAFAKAVYAETAQFKKQSETLEGATRLMAETGQSSIVDAISIAARRTAIRKGATL